MTPALSATTTYSYDVRGNRISATNGADTTTYSYDALDRLISVSLPTGMTAGYRYDADGRRVESLLGGQVARYLWDEASTYGDVVLETNGDGEMLASYVLGGMSLISQTREDETRYYTQDALGSTRALTDASGSLTDSYSYTAFGDLFAQTGSTANSYLFTGQQHDAATGLYSMRARYYDPAVGRFLTQDIYPVDYSNPLELNRYVYVANNPVNATDPSGHVGNVMTWGLTAQATTGGGGNGPRGRLGAVMGGLAGAAVSGILAHSRYNLMQAGLCGPRLEQFTREVSFPVFMAMSMATGALAGGVIGHAAGGGLPTQLLSQISFALAVMSLTPTAIDIIFQGNSQAFCNVLDVIVGIGGLLLGASGGSPPTTAGEVVVTGNTLAIVGEQINSVLAGASAALMMSSGSPGGGSDGGSGGTPNEVPAGFTPEEWEEFKADLQNTLDQAGVSDVGGELYTQGSRLTHPASELTPETDLDIMLRVSPETFRKLETSLRQSYANNLPRGWADTLARGQITRQMLMSRTWGRFSLTPRLWFDDFWNPWSARVGINELDFSIIQSGTQLDTPPYLPFRR